MDDLTRDERKLEEGKLIANGIEALWDDLQSATKRAVTAHNELHRGDAYHWEAQTVVNNSDTAIIVSYRYRAFALAIVDATLKLSLDRKQAVLCITGNPDGRQTRAIGQFRTRADLTAKTLHFADSKGDLFSAVQVADFAVAERFFDKRA